MPLQCNTGKYGLGMSFMDKPKVSKSAKKKQDILQKTQNRYRNIEEVPTSMDSE